jgi:diaminopimelate decarboxylase
MGLWFDASSGYEIMRAVRCGIPPSHISLSSQEMPLNFETLFQLGIDFNACSLNQLETFGKLFPGGSCGVRLNPGRGSGANFKTDVGGPAASFGIWHEQIPEIKAIAKKYDIKIVRVHTHIGSGSDPTVWQSVAEKSLDMCNEFPLATTLNMGGGYKVARMPHDKQTVLADIGLPVKGAFERFRQRTGRALQLEIEPGTYLTANAGSLLCAVQDIVSTGAEGFTFAKLDTGMTEILRPAMYGSHHPIIHLGTPGAQQEASQEEGGKKFVVV